MGRILVPTAFIAFGLGDFMPVTGLDVYIQLGLLMRIVGGRVKLHFRGSEGWLLSERGGREHCQSDERQAGHDFFHLKSPFLIPS